MRKVFLNIKKISTADRIEGRLTVRRIISHIYPSVLILIMTISFVFYYDGLEKYGSDFGYWIVHFIILLIVLPNILLFINYMKRGINQFIVIDNEANTVTVMNANKESIYSLNDINKVKIGFSTGNILSIWNEYAYSILYLKDGGQIIITSLCMGMDELLIFFQEKKIVEEGTLFPFVSVSV